MNDNYDIKNSMELLAAVKKSFLEVDDKDTDKILEVLDGMETFDGAATLAIAMMSIINASSSTPKGAAMALAAFSSVMIGFLMHEEEEKQLKQ